MDLDFGFWGFLLSEMSCMGATYVYITHTRRLNAQERRLNEYYLEKEKRLDFDESIFAAAIANMKLIFADDHVVANIKEGSKGSVKEQVIKALRVLAPHSNEACIFLSKLS
jgi:hypothetical protein